MSHAEQPAAEQPVKSNPQTHSRAASRGELSTLASALGEIHEHFIPGTLIALMRFDLQVLARIEAGHGGEARDVAESRFVELIRDVASERLADCDVVVTGEPGRNEVLVLLFREHQDARFYRQELPGFSQVVSRKLEREGAKLFYPYLKKVPVVEMGYAVVMRNPKLAVETQLRQVLEEARKDAELNVAISDRKRRRRFHELVLDRRVYSVYEPIVEVETNVVFAYEALARGPEGSEFHYPIAMFTEASRQGLVYELDCLCRGSGLAGAVDFPEGSKLFLNVLPSAIHDPDFQAERLIRTLDGCRLSPTDVVFEVSEQESIRDFDAFREMRDYYRNLGFQFALDDTGSGYAGLEALMEISPEFIKIDRAFVSGVDQDPVRQDVLRSLRSMAEKTGARIIGEGLDTLEELAMLGELGIDYGQGWLFGKPMPLRAREQEA